MFKPDKHGVNSLLIRGFFSLLIFGEGGDIVLSK